jgi:hypothetical protein
MQFKFSAVWFFFLTMFVLQGMAQKLIPVRIEVPGDLNAETYKVVPVEDQGVLIFYESNETDENGKRLWYFGLLDKRLKQKWLKSVPLDTKLHYVASRKTKQKVYFLFKNREKVSRDYDIYEFVVFDRKAERFTNLTGSVPYKSKISGFELVQNHACVGLQINGRQSDLAFVDLTSGEIKPVHLNKEEEAMIENIYVDKRSKRFYVVVKYFNSVSFFKDVIYAFTPRGEQLLEMEVSYPDNLRLPVNYRFATISDDKISLLGTYDLITARRPSWKDVSNTEDSDREAASAGFFYLSFKNGKQEQLVFYDFMKFDNTYYSVHGKEIRTTKDKNSDLKKVNVFYKINNPKITDLENEKVFSVELYKPYYKTETRMDYDFYGRPYPVTYEIFAGYEFYDVIFSGFDKNGNMVWNNDFAIDDLRTYSLGDHVLIVPDKNLLTLAYVNKGNIITQTFDKSNDLSEREKIPLETAFKKDRITQDENNKLKHWYGDYYIVYGYQRLRNRSLKEKSNRTVFFINKIALK